MKQFHPDQPQVNPLKTLEQRSDAFFEIASICIDCEAVML